MEAKELRIGNLVEYKITDSQDHRKEWWELNPIDVFDLQHLVEFPEDGFFRPIPLTEEWLLKFGFGESYWQRSGKFAHWMKDGVIWFDGDLNCIVYYRVTEIKYVHQLQNLYHSLCGEELRAKT